MSMIKIVENNSGGQIGIDQWGRPEQDSSLFTPVYLSLFGGNVEGITIADRNPDGIDNNDWFGNLTLQKDGQVLFNSKFEKIITNEPIISGNIQRFKEAALFDLNWMKEKKIAASINVEISIVNPQQLSVIVTLYKADNTEEKYEYLWENSRNE